MGLLNLNHEMLKSSLIFNIVTDNANNIAVNANEDNAKEIVDDQNKQIAPPNIANEKEPENVDNVDNLANEDVNKEEDELKDRIVEPAQNIEQKNNPEEAVPNNQIRPILDDDNENLEKDDQEKDDQELEDHQLKAPIDNPDAKEADDGDNRAVDDLDDADGDQDPDGGKKFLLYYKFDIEILSLIMQSNEYNNTQYSCHQ